jgi:uncharacterized protein involved in outer membrane biogenesis
MPRPVRVLLSVLALLLVLLGGALAWVTWFPDTLKRPLERALTASLGQEVRIEGPLVVHPGRVTTVELHGLHVAAPAWARADDFLAIDRLRVGGDLWAYLRHRTISITELVVDAPRVALERNQDGQTSWPSGGGSAKSRGGVPDLSIGRIEISDGRIDALDAPTGADLAATMATERDAGLKLDGAGKIGADPLRFGLHAGSLEQAAEAKGPLRVDGTLELAATRVELKGAIAQPAIPAGIDLGLTATSGDPSGLLSLLGRAHGGPAPPFELAGRVTGGGGAYALQDLHGHWGDSNLAGELKVDLARDKPRLDGTLQAPLIDVTALLPFLHAEHPTDQPMSENPLQMLAGYEGSLRLTAAEVRLPPQIVLRDSTAALELADDRLRVADLRVGMPEGAVSGNASTSPLDGPQLTADLRLDAAGLGIASLAGGGYEGTLDGHLDGTLAAGPLQNMLARSRLRFEGRGDGLVVPQAKLGSLVVTALLDQGRLHLDPFQAKLPQGSLDGRVTAGPFDDGFAADLDLNASGIDLAAAARTDGVAGRLDGHVAGTLRGTDPLAILTRSRLELDGTIADLELPQIERRVDQAKVQATLDPDRRESLKVVANARAGDRPLTLTAFGGSFATLAQNRGEYPFTVNGELAKNEVEVNGTMTMPLTDRNFTAKIRAKGPDPSPLLALFQLPKLQIPPYRLSGTVATHGSDIRLTDFDGRIGDSDLAADLTLSNSGERPKVSGKIRSKVLDADDLGGLVGSTPGTGPGETASGGQKNEAKRNEAKATVLPDEPINPSRWRKIDADLDLRADKIQAGKIPLEGFSGKLTMNDGLLVVDPLDLRAGEGHVTGRIKADGRRAPVSADVSLDVRRVSVARLLNRLDVDLGTLGVLSGNARGGVGLGAEGFSIKDMLAHSNGKVELLMEGGQIDRTIVAGLGLDLLRLLGSAVGATPDSVELRCAVAGLDIGDGIVRTDPVVIDTAISDLGGRGTINLKTEAIDISLTARPKETPLLTDLTGISIGGTLGAPQLNINPLAVAARGVAAATLGVVLKPFTSLAGAADDERPSPCADLLRQRSSAENG